MVKGGFEFPERARTHRVAVAIFYFCFRKHQGNSKLYIHFTQTRYSTQRLTLLEKTKKQETYQAGKRDENWYLLFSLISIFEVSPLYSCWNIPSLSCLCFTHVVFFWLAGLAQSSVFFLPTAHCARLVLLSFGLLSVVAAFAPPFYPFTYRFLLLWLSATPIQIVSLFQNFLPFHFFLASMSPLASAASVSGILTGLHRSCHGCLCVVLYNFYTGLRTIQSPLPFLFWHHGSGCERQNQFSLKHGIFKHVQAF